MKRFTITNLITGVVFISEGETNAPHEPAWGKPERWVSESECSSDDLLASLETRVVNEITEHRLPDEFTIIETDITASKAQEQTNQQALAYLASTDWYIIRESDDGTPCPTEIKTARAAARASIV